MPNLSSDLQMRLGNIALIAMDVDGVLTDGGVYILENGEEFRRFNIKDGMGLKRVMAQGIEVVWISAGETCGAAEHRARHLGVEEVYVAVLDKLKILAEICERKSLSFDQVAYIGDDLTDLEAMQQVGIACAPADAVDGVKQAATYVTRSRGGHGAVREFCDWLLAAFNSHNIEPNRSRK